MLDDEPALRKEKEETELEPTFHRTIRSFDEAEKMLHDTCADFV